MQTQDPAQLAHNEYARTRIRVAVQRLGRHLKLSRADREDVEQDLWVNLLEQAHNFDPERGAINTFIDRVVRSAVAMKIRHHRRDKESVKRRIVSLDGPSTEGATGTAPAATRVPEDHHATRTGGVAHDSIAAIEDREAYERALESIPEDLLALCERVATQTQSQIVDELHIGKRTILEGQEAFERAFAIGGPVNPKTGLPFGSGTKSWAEWAEAQGKDVLTSDQAQLVTQMAASVKAHPLAQRLLADGVAEGVVRANYVGIPCQIRMDWFDLSTGIVDLKTVDTLDYFEVDARRYGYCHQLACYVAVLQQRIGIRAPAFFIVVEKREPFRCGVWKVTAARHSDINLTMNTYTMLGVLDQAAAVEALPPIPESLKASDRGNVLTQRVPA